MKIKKLPRPHLDETFTSWIYRCAINQKCMNVTQGDVDSYVRQWRVGGKTIDIDFDLEAAPFATLCTNIGLNLSCVVPFFSLPCFTIPLSYWFRYAYCQECLDSDVQVFGFPYWRKEWCYIDCSCCLLHKSLLSILNDEQHTDAHKPWRAFANANHDVNIMLDSSYRAAGRRYRQPKQLVREQYVCRVQRFLCAARRSKRIFLPRLGRDVNSNCVFQCSNILLCTFLSVRTDRQVGGIARQLLTEIPDKIYHANLSKRSRMLVGAEEAIPCIRFIAIFLVGWIFGIISDAEFSQMRGYAIDQFYWLPSSIKELGSIAASFDSSDEYIWYISLFKPVSLELRKGLLPFFEGVNEKFEAEMKSFFCFKTRDFNFGSRKDQLSRWFD